MVQQTGDGTQAIEKRHADPFQVASFVGVGAFDGARGSATDGGQLPIKTYGRLARVQLNPFHRAQHYGNVSADHWNEERRMRTGLGFLTNGADEHAVFRDTNYD